MKHVGTIGWVVIKELYRRKDFYVLFVLTALLTIGMGSMNFFKEETIVRYLKEVCLLLIWISSLIIAITTAARQIPMELENRTLYPLLAKPITRSELMVGKFWGCWMAVGIALLVFYGFFILLSGSREHTWPLLNYFQAAVFHWVFLGIVIALSLLGSLVFAAPSSNSTIVFVVVGGLLLLGGHLLTLSQKTAEPGQTILTALYYLLPHLEFFDVRSLIIHDYPLIPWGPWFIGTLYGLAYGGLFLTAACWRFRRKALN